MPGKLHRLQEFNAALEPLPAYNPRDPTDRMLIQLAVRAMGSSGHLNEAEMHALGRLLGGKSLRDVELLLQRDPLASADSLDLDELLAYFSKPNERQALMRYVGLLGRADTRMDDAEFAFWSELEKRLRRA